MTMRQVLIYAGEPEVSFSYGPVAKGELIGNREFSGYWAQYLGDGTFDIFDTKDEMLTWLAEWAEICWDGEPVDEYISTVPKGDLFGFF